MPTFNTEAFFKFLIRTKFCKIALTNHEEDLSLTVFTATYVEILTTCEKMGIKKFTREDIENFLRDLDFTYRWFPRRWEIFIKKGSNRYQMVQQMFNEINVHNKLSKFKAKDLKDFINTK